MQATQDREHLRILANVLTLKVASYVKFTTRNSNMNGKVEHSADSTTSPELHVRAFIYRGELWLRCRPNNYLKGLTPFRAVALRGSFFGVNVCTGILRRFKKDMDKTWVEFPLPAQVNLWQK